ncbi:MAG: hypothetical protein IPF99_27205 [Deltaproteobacteria bacterium]|nr:hypothetical protein [Deltaproteobacteria bacterium]
MGASAMARISWVRCSAVGCVPAIRSERSRAPESNAVARRFVGTGGLPPSALGGSIGEGTGKVSVPPSEVRIVEVLVATATEGTTRAAGDGGAGARTAVGGGTGAGGVGGATAGGGGRGGAVRSRSTVAERGRVSARSGGTRTLLASSTIPACRTIGAATASQESARRG